MKLALIIIVLPIISLADVKDCYNQMTQEPFCVSKLNADVFCSSLGVQVDIFLNAKKCILDSRSSGLSVEQANKLCMGVSIVSQNNHGLNKSNCAAVETLNSTAKTIANNQYNF